jgi:hypothetical protein
LTSKTVLLEDLRSEKRILQAERQEALLRLLNIQRDLQDVIAMEEKVVLETQKIERDLLSQRENEEYLQTRGNTPRNPTLTSERVSELRRKHNLPELPPLIRNRDEETAQYLQARINDRLEQANLSQ